MLIQKFRKRSPNYLVVLAIVICQYLSEVVSKSKGHNLPLVNIIEKLDYYSICGQINMTDNQIIYSSIAVCN